MASRVSSGKRSSSGAARSRSGIAGDEEFIGPGEAEYDRSPGQVVTRRRFTSPRHASDHDIPRNRSSTEESDIGSRTVSHARWWICSRPDRRDLFDGTLGGATAAASSDRNPAAACGSIGIPSRARCTRLSASPRGPRQPAASRRRPVSAAGVAFDGALLDLGVSSHQIDTPARGFAFDADAPLDMRMGGEGPTAADLLNELPVDELADVFRRYGEEPFAGPLARSIVAARRTRPITSSAELSRCSARRPGHQSRESVRPSLQALRIAVKDELGRLEAASEVLARRHPWRRAVLSTIPAVAVKRFFAARVDPWVCRPIFPYADVAARPRRAAQRAARSPPPPEIAAEFRARSGRLRAAEACPRHARFAEPRLARGRESHDRLP